MLPAAAARMLRKLLLAFGRRMDMQQMLQRSHRGALRQAARAAQHSSAYRTLLGEHGVAVDSIDADTGLHTLPVLTKDNTFGRFRLDQLARPFAARELADVLTSSGRSGGVFGFRLSSRRQHEASWFDIDLGLQDVFDIDARSTLVVNCLPMGVSFRSRAAAVANVSVRADMACAILRDVGPRFAQTIVCTDPLFVRALLDEAQRVGLDWRVLNASMILGEEMLVETQRDYIAARLHIDIESEPHRLVGSSFGVGELGLNLLFETRDTIRMRRALPQGALAAAVDGTAMADGNLPSVFCFNPLRCHVEILQPTADGYGELCFTMLDRNPIIALPRFCTGDMGRLMPHPQVAQLAAKAGVPPPWLPVVAVLGRLGDRRSATPSVEQVKEVLYADHSVADELTGAFVITDARSIVFQRSPSASEPASLLGHKLDGLLASARFPQWQARVIAWDAFAERPLLDYERKFGYVRTAATRGSE